MPVYSIMNKETEEVFEVTMKFSDFEHYLSNNPQYKQVFTRFPGIGDPIRQGVRKPDDGFKDVLKTVQSHHKKDSINSW